MKIKNMIILTFIIITVHLHCQENHLYTVIQDFGPATDRIGRPFLSKVQVIKFNKEVTVVTPAECLLVSIIDSGLAKDYGEFVPENLTILQFDKNVIVGIFNMKIENYKIGDIISKSKIIGKIDTLKDYTMLMYLKTEAIFEDMNFDFLLEDYYLYLNPENITQMENFTYFKASDFIDFSTMFTE